MRFGIWSRASITAKSVFRSDWLISPGDVLWTLPVDVKYNQGEVQKLKPVIHMRYSLRRFHGIFTGYGKGVLVSAIVGAAALFLSEHYGAPTMLMALLLGMALNFLSDEDSCKAGIDLSARSVLRFGVALLGLKISISMMIGLGPQLISVVVLGVISTIAFGVFSSRLLGQDWNFGLLSGGAVAICGASAAMAIIAVLPKDENSERNLIFTVLSVTLLSTLAMIVYPLLTDMLNFSDELSGVFLGGTIHDVAQVVGAGFSISEGTGEVATLVKLFRVAMLAPIVLIISLLMRRQTANKSNEGVQPPILPVFVVGFLMLAVLNSLNLIPNILLHSMSELSRFALVIAIAAVGMKTSLKSILEVQRQAIYLVVAETLFIALFVLLGMKFLGY